MTLEIKVKNLMLSKEVIKNLLGQKLKASLVYKLTKTLKKVSDEIETYDDVVKKKVMEYGSPKEEDPNMYQVNPENFAKFNDEMVVLQEQDISLDCDKIKIEDLEEFTLSGDELRAIWWLLEHDSAI